MSCGISPISWRCHGRVTRSARFGFAAARRKLARSARTGDLVDGLPCAGSSRGFPVWYLVPDGVVQYISKHHLYRS